MSSEPRKSGSMQIASDPLGYYFSNEEVKTLVKALFRMSNIHRMQVELMSADEAFAAGLLLGTAFKIKDELNLTMDITP